LHEEGKCLWHPPSFEELEYASIWTGTTVGVNWFVRKYAIRFSANYSLNNNVNGVTDTYETVGRIQAQFAW